MLCYFNRIQVLGAGSDGGSEHMAFNGGRCLKIWISMGKWLALDMCVPFTGNGGVVRFQLGMILVFSSC